MEIRQTTEELFTKLTPDQRVEAIRLAARLQDQGEEGSGLVAAAREAGIRDDYLQEAARRMKSEPRSEPTVTPSAAPWLSLSLERWTDRKLTIVPASGFLLMLTLVQGWLGLVAYNLHYFAHIGVAFLLTGLLAAASARAGAKSAIAKVFAVWWIVFFVANHIVSAGPMATFPLQPNESFGLELALKAMLATAVGVVIGWPRPSMTTTRKSASPQS